MSCRPSLFITTLRLDKQYLISDLLDDNLLLLEKSISYDMPVCKFQKLLLLFLIWQGAPIFQIQVDRGREREKKSISIKTIDNRSTALKAQSEKSETARQFKLCVVSPSFKSKGHENIR